MPLKARIFFAVLLVAVWCNGAYGQCENRSVLTLMANEYVQTFTSPNFPNDYPNNLYCQWLIVAPSTIHIVELTTIVLDIEVSVSCTYDNIAVYNGKDKTTSNMRRFCFGNMTVHTTNRYLLVVFESDGSNEGKGFKLGYRFREKGHVTPTRPSTTLRHPQTNTTTAPAGDGDSSPDKRLLIGGVVGGIAFIVIVAIICGRCHRDGGPRQPPAHRPAAFYHSHVPSSPLHVEDATIHSTTVHMMQSRTVPPHPLTNGVTNMAFDGKGDPFGGAPKGVPPPSYDETIMDSHPAAVPPTPQHTPGRPFPGFLNRAGLVPPPLYASREQAAPAGTPPVSQQAMATGGTGATSQQMNPTPSSQSPSHPRDVLQQPVDATAGTSASSSAAPSAAEKPTVSPEEDTGETNQASELSSNPNSSSNPTD